MILGIGNDLIDIRRIDKTIQRHGERFLDRVYTDIERAKSDRRAARAASYAKRFAAKEACAKALGTGLNQGVYWRDMGVVNLPGGKPTIAVDRRGPEKTGKNHAGGPSGPNRPDHHRRFSPGPGHCHYFCRARGPVQRLIKD